jgi:hypothetical protein
MTLDANLPQTLESPQAETQELLSRPVVWVIRREYEIPEEEFEYFRQEIQALQHQKTQ